jgi:NTE family protein
MAIELADERDDREARCIKAPRLQTGRPFVLRPSEDIGKIAGAYEKQLPRNLKLITRALGSRETESPDVLSMLMFVPEYTSTLMEIGENDVGSRLNELRAFLGETAGTAISAV